MMLAESVVEGWWIPIVVTVIAAVAVQAIRLIKKGGAWLEKKMGATENEKEMMLNIQEGISFAQDSIVRELKAATDDHKLTSAEIQKVKSVAIKHAMDVAKGPVLALMKEYGTRKLGALLEMQLSKFKPN